MKTYEITPGKTYQMLDCQWSKPVMPRLVLSYDPSGEALGGKVRAVRVRYGRPMRPVEIYCGAYFAEHVIV